MSNTKQSAEDLAILEQLNLDHNQADQASDAKRFSEFLADDFRHGRGINFPSLFASRRRSPSDVSAGQNPFPQVRASAP